MQKKKEKRYILYLIVRIVKKIQHKRKLNNVRYCLLGNNIDSFFAYGNIICTTSFVSATIFNACGIELLEVLNPAIVTHQC